MGASGALFFETQPLAACARGRQRRARRALAEVSGAPGSPAGTAARRRRTPASGQSAHRPSLQPGASSSRAAPRPAPLPRGEEGERGSTCRPTPLRDSVPVAECCDGERLSPATPRPSPTAEPLGTGPGPAAHPAPSRTCRGPGRASRPPPTPPQEEPGARALLPPGPARARQPISASLPRGALERGGAGPRYAAGGRRRPRAVGCARCAPLPSVPGRTRPGRDMPCAAPAAPRGATRAMSQAAVPSQVEAGQMSEGAQSRRGRGRRAGLSAALADPC